MKYELVVVGASRRTASWCTAKRPRPAPSSIPAPSTRRSSRPSPTWSSGRPSSSTPTVTLIHRCQQRHRPKYPSPWPCTPAISACSRCPITSSSASCSARTTHPRPAVSWPRVTRSPSASPRSGSSICRGTLRAASDSCTAASSSSAILFSAAASADDLPGGSWKDLEKSIRERITLPEETVVLPGHGPWTTVEQERSSIPFLT